MSRGADYHSTVAVEETEVYVWAAVDVETFEVIYIEVSPGRSNPDALLFIKQVLECCRGDPVVLVDRGPWYNWALDDLNPCESRRETWGNGLGRSLVRPAQIPNQALLQPVPHQSSRQSVDRWVKAFAALHNVIL